MVVGVTAVGEMAVLLDIPYVALVDAQIGGGAAGALHHTLAAHAEVSPFQLGAVRTSDFPVDVPNGTALVLLHQPIFTGVDLHKDVQLRLHALLLLGGVYEKHISPRNPYGHSKKKLKTQSSEPGGITGELVAMFDYNRYRHSI